MVVPCGGTWGLAQAVGWRVQGGGVWSYSRSGGESTLLGV